MPVWLIALLPTIVEGLIQIIEDIINKKSLSGPDLEIAQQGLLWLQGYKARNDELNAQKVKPG